jgi:hypothetical protein
MQNNTEYKTYFVRITLGLSEAAARGLDVGARRVRVKVQARACVNEGHDRLARGRALRGGFELGRIYSFKLAFNPL